jgi:hypothetical protein
MRAMALLRPALLAGLAAALAAPVPAAADCCTYAVPSLGGLVTDGQRTFLTFAAEEPGPGDSVFDGRVVELGPQDATPLLAGAGAVPSIAPRPGGRPAVAAVLDGRLRAGTLDGPQADLSGGGPGTRAALAPRADGSLLVVRREGDRVVRQLVSAAGTASAPEEVLAGPVEDVRLVPDGEDVLVAARRGTTAFVTRAASPSGAAGAAGAARAAATASPAGRAAAVDTVREGARRVLGVGRVGDRVRVLLESTRRELELVGPDLAAPVVLSRRLPGGRAAQGVLADGAVAFLARGTAGRPDVLARDLRSGRRLRVTRTRATESVVAGVVRVGDGLRVALQRDRSRTARTMVVAGGARELVLGAAPRVPLAQAAISATADGSLTVAWIRPGGGDLGGCGPLVSRTVGPAGTSPPRGVRRRQQLTARTGARHPAPVPGTWCGGRGVVPAGHAAQVPGTLHRCLAPGA